MSESFYSVCCEFLNVVRDTYIFYLDGFKGLEMLRADLEHRPKSCPDDRVYVPYVKQHNDPLELRGLDQTTLSQFKQRNSENGRNYEMLGNLCLVAIYSWWEDCYREKFAAYLGKTKNEIKSPIMADIRLLRTAIVHNNGVATSDCEKCKLLKWFKRSDRILLTFEHFERINLEIKKFLDDFYRQSLIVGKS